METTKGNQMNKYLQMCAITRLSQAEGIVKSLDEKARWDRDTLTVGEFVAIKLAVEDALRLLREDLLSRVEN